MGTRFATAQLKLQARPIWLSEEMSLQTLFKLVTCWCAGMDGSPVRPHKVTYMVRYIQTWAGSRPVDSRLCPREQAAATTVVDRDLTSSLYRHCLQLHTMLWLNGQLYPMTLLVISSCGLPVSRSRSFRIIIRSTCNSRDTLLAEALIYRLRGHYVGLRIKSGLIRYIRADIAYISPDIANQPALNP